MKVISPKVDASIKSEGALPRGNISLIFCDMILTSSREMSKHQKGLEFVKLSFNDCKKSHPPCE